MKFCCGVTLYYPSDKELESIWKYSEIFECVYVFDNTESNGIKVENKKIFSNNNRFIYLTSHQNEGLSRAFNIMCREAILRGYDYIALFDQDSIMDLEDLKKIIDYIKNDKGKNAVALYAPEIIYMKSSHLDKKKTINYNEIQKPYGIEVKWAISSGSFINLAIYKEIGGFDENYFIDRLDYDYCYLVRKKGYKVIIIRNTYLYQRLGEERQGMLRKGLQHNSIRHYYMFRNRLYFYLKKDGLSIFNLLLILILSFKHIATILFLEQEKIGKLRMVIKGMRDFILGKMGKYEE